MNENKKQENIKEDKKAILPYVLITIASSLVGGAIGFLSMRAIDHIDIIKNGQFGMVWLKMQQNASFPAQVLLLISGIILFSIAFYYYKKAKRIWDNRQEEEEIEQVEKELENSINYVNIYNYTNMILYGIASYMISSQVEKGTYYTVSFTVCTVVFMINILVAVEFQRRLVNFVKIINPEKQGSVYDSKFQEKWMESCDEAERIQIGAASYKAFQVLNTVCVILWVLLCIAGMFLEIGILSHVILGIVWLFTIIAYQAEAKKMSM